MPETDPMQVWRDFCRQLERAGEQILRPEAPGDALTRAEGWRYLTRLLRIGLEMHLECADPAFPAFFMPSHETGKIGADNPDNRYLMARIDGRHRYRIRGRRGSVPYLSFGSQKGGYETDGRMEQTGFLDARSLSAGADQALSITLGEQPPADGSPWLRIEPLSNAVIVRQTFNDRRRETPAELVIERLDAGTTPEPLTPQRLAQGLARTGAFVEGTARVFADWAQSYLPHLNQLPFADQGVCQKAGGDPNILYYHSAWQLDPSQALIVHLPRIPDCRFWNLQINNWWMESLDYRHHRIHHNGHTARPNADGSVTLVLAHGAVDHPNALDTAGHAVGTLCLRWVGARERVDPVTRVVPLAGLAGALATLEV